MFNNKHPPPILVKIFKISKYITGPPIVGKFTDFLQAGCFFKYKIKKP